MIDALLVGAFVAYCLGVGLQSRREASRDLETYFLAGRRISAWESGLSMAATQYAADTPSSGEQSRAIQTSSRGVGSRRLRPRHSSRA